jgi:hypothetical protein
MNQVKCVRPGPELQIFFFSGISSYFKKVLVSRFVVYPVAH